MLQKRIPILKAEQIQKKVINKRDIKVSLKEVRQVLREALNLSWRTAKPIPIQCNSERCLVLRQQYAIKMLPLLRSGKVILNIDESWINTTSFIRKVWCPVDAPSTVTQRAVTPRLSLIAALDIEGRVYFSLTQDNTDQNVMLVFLRHLILTLDEERPNWRGDTIILLDGARYHTGEKIRDYIHKL